jgi:anti-anti-sigma regulatory factor
MPSLIDDPWVAAQWDDRLHIAPCPTGCIALLSLAGDIDAITLPLLCTALVTALGRRPAHLVVDLPEIRYCGVRGFVLLAATARASAAIGIGYAVSGVGSHLERAARRIWSDQRLICYPTAAAAVAAICEQPLAPPPVDRMSSSASSAPR